MDQADAFDPEDKLAAEGFRFLAACAFRNRGLHVITASLIPLELHYLELTFDGVFEL